MHLIDFKSAGNGVKLYVQAIRERRQKKIWVELIVEGIGEMPQERTIIGRYSPNAIRKKMHEKDLGDVFSIFAFDESEEVKHELEDITRQIVEYVSSEEFKQNEDFSILEAYNQLLEYVRQNENSPYWKIKDDICVVYYERLGELLSLVDCGWNDRLEFMRNLVVNDLVFGGNERKQTREGKKWVLRIKVVGL